MGHIRLGRLPKTVRWRGVVGLLDHAPDDVPAVARATVVAAESHLRSLSRDPSLTYCFWLLVRLASATRKDDFTGALVRLGIDATRTDSAVGFVSLVNQRVRDEVVGNVASGPFGEIASLALRRTLLETIGQHGRSLFDSSVDDIHTAFRSHATPRQVGELSQRFFGDYLSRTLRFFIEKELSNSVGASHGLTTISDSTQFTEALDLYARQSARITRDFAADWYDKHRWEARGEISRDEVQAFVAVALAKLRAELRQVEP